MCFWCILFWNFSSSEDQEFIIELRKQADRDKSVLAEENRKLSNEIEKVGGILRNDQW